MPKFTVVAIEKFTHRSTYRNIEAPTQEAAVQKIKDAEAPYDETEVLEGGEVYIETESIDQES